jgi:hypothetical protein
MISALVQQQPQQQQQQPSTQLSLIYNAEGDIPTAVALTAVVKEEGVLSAPFDGLLRHYASTVRLAIEIYAVPYSANPIGTRSYPLQSFSFALPGSASLLAAQPHSNGGLTLPSLKLHTVLSQLMISLGRDLSALYDTQHKLITSAMHSKTFFLFPKVKRMESSCPQTFPNAFSPSGSFYIGFWIFLPSQYNPKDAEGVACDEGMHILSRLVTHTHTHIYIYI